MENAGKRLYCINSIIKEDIPIMLMMITKNKEV